MVVVCSALVGCGGDVPVAPTVEETIPTAVMLRITRAFPRADSAAVGNPAWMAQQFRLQAGSLVGGEAHAARVAVSPVPALGEAWRGVAVTVTQLRTEADGRYQPQRFAFRGALLWRGEGELLWFSQADSARVGRVVRLDAAGDVWVSDSARVTIDDLGDRGPCPGPSLAPQTIWSNDSSIATTFSRSCQQATFDVELPSITLHPVDAAGRPREAAPVVVDLARTRVNGARSTVTIRTTRRP